MRPNFARKGELGCTARPAVTLQSPLFSGGTSWPEECITYRAEVLRSRTRSAVLRLASGRQFEPEGALIMEWVTPQHEEIDLNCEVSSYANAEL